MKTKFTSLCLCAGFFLSILFPQRANAQPPILNFNTYNLDSGTALTAGAVYRFYNVTTNVDALVKVATVNGGITLRNIDRTIDGYSEAFQPEYRIIGNTNAYIDFTIRFVAAGTSTPVILPVLAATGLDIDGSPNGGNSLKEFNQMDMGGGTYEFNSYDTEITVSQTGNSISGNNATGNLFGTLVDTTAKQVMFTVTNSNVSVMTYRVGSNNQTSSNSTRYASLYYKPFTYQHYPLAISGMLSFDAVAVNNDVKLTWALASDNYSKVVLEKSNNGTSFAAVYQETSAVHSRSAYTDAEVNSSMVFYRLKTIGNDGRTEYSSIVSVKMSSSIPGQVKVYPTLIQSGTTVVIDVMEKSAAVVLVADYAGRVVKQKQVNLLAGSNSISLDGFDQLNRGNYIVSVQAGKSRYAQKVIVQ